MPSSARPGARRRGTHRRARADALLGALAALLVPASGEATTPEGSGTAGLFRYPDVSATDIVFVYGGDLWLVGREGGTARPLTGDGGPKSFPRFSADGRTVAFTGRFSAIHRA